MPRQVRIEFPGAYYHVMARGDRREDIYLDDADREMFLATLTTACKRTGWRIHAYVLKKGVGPCKLQKQPPSPNRTPGILYRLRHRPVTSYDLARASMPGLIDSKDSVGLDLAYVFMVVRTAGPSPA